MTTRFPNGITNIPSAHPMRGLLGPHPARWALDFEDFFRFAAAEWTITKVGTGTTVLTGGDGGLLLSTNSAAAPDSNAFQRTVANLRLDKKKDAFFEMRLSLSSAAACIAVAGLQALDATPFAVSDGIYFNKLTGVATADLAVFKASTGSLALLSNVLTFADGVMTKIQWYYDASAARLIVGQDDVVKGYTDALANFPDTVDLTASFAQQNAAAVARSMTIDYVMAGRQR